MFSNFRYFLSSCDLVDLRHSGNFFSWRGKRGDHLVHCRLDWTLANSAWPDLFPNGRSQYLQFEGSDHLLVISTFNSKRKKPQRIFRYDRRLRDNQELKLLIDKAWKENLNLSVMNRISRCMHAISNWSKNHYVNIQKTINQLRGELDIAMTAHTIDDAYLSSLN